MNKETLKTILVINNAVMNLMDCLDNNDYENIDKKHIDMLQDSMLKVALLILRYKESNLGK